MAALQSIRKKGGLIAFAVGFALLAFILGDFINSSSTIFGQSQYEMGEINGNSIDYQDFLNRSQQREQFIKIVTNNSSLSGEMSDQIHDYVWQQLIVENVILNNTDKLGIQASDDELINLIENGKVTPTMRQLFTNPETGVYDKNIVLQIAKTSESDPTTNFIWQCLEDELRVDRTTEKYINMIAAGLCVTTAEVEKEFAERTEISDVKFVSFPFSEVKDEEVSVSDADIQKYFKENEKKYYRSQETRDVAYVTFDIDPSQKDSTYSLDIINGLKDGFASTEDVQSFINSKSDIQYRDIHYSKGDITNETVDSLMFAQTPGFVYGPYQEGEYYKLARLIKNVSLPDSIEVSHILIAGDTTTAKIKADSLLGVIKSGIDFGAIASEYSDDTQSAKDSGKLGWITENMGLIPEFLDACFATEKGKISTVSTVYGIHIIKVTNKTAPKNKVSVGFLQIEIRTSKETRQVAYALANKFAAETRKPSEFDNAIQTQGLLRKIAPGLTSDTRFVSGLENSREFVRWAFDEEKSKEVSDIMEFGDKYIVAAVVGIHPVGKPSLNSIKETISSELLSQKKGEKIINDLQSKNVSSVDALAAQVDKPVQDANNVNLSTVVLGNNYDPIAVAVASSLGQNEVSKPFIGRNAVYVIQNTSKTPAQQIQPINITTDRNVMQNDIRSRASYQPMNALIDMANIIDNRYKFF
ncbi:MAG: SurA N-terminal domain-containing protein [Bacteroidales bacterium]|nr:SurA N-terminal domain-containing protein [Bacteroidales bacterium]